MTKLKLRVEFAPDRAVGPGKIRLLELIGDARLHLGGRLGPWG